MAQLVKNLLAMWESWVCFLGWEDPLEKGMSTHSGILGQPNTRVASGGSREQKGCDGELLGTSDYPRGL